MLDPMDDDTTISPLDCRTTNILEIKSGIDVAMDIKTSPITWILVIIIKINRIYLFAVRIIDYSSNLYFLCLYTNRGRYSGCFSYNSCPPYHKVRKNRYPNCATHKCPKEKCNS